jgi:hypothetical protein
MQVVAGSAAYRPTAKGKLPEFDPTKSASNKSNV